MNNLPAPIQKCMVHNCKNHAHEGGGVMPVINGTPYFICSPCYQFLSCGTGKFSQLYRNA